MREMRKDIEMSANKRKWKKFDIYLKISLLKPSDDLWFIYFENRFLF